MKPFLTFALCLSMCFVFPSSVFAVTPASIYTPTTWQQSGSERNIWNVIPGVDLENDTIRAYSQDRTDRSVFLVEVWGEVGKSSSSVFPQFSDFDVSFYLRPLQGFDRDFVWHYLDEDNYYQLHFSGSAAEVTRRVSGNLLLTAGKNVTLQQGEEYLVQAKSAEGKIEVWLNDEPIISAIDWTYSLHSAGSIELTENHKFGFRLAPGTIVPVENEFRGLKIQSVGSLNLLVPFYRQNDELWKNLQYDHANNWSSNPTMARWGCVVTSAAMVFNYHGLEQLPGGDQLTPQSLNLWLVSQSDGYVGNGFVNWLALTRLSREIHDRFPDKNLPKFEFTRFSLGGNPNGDGFEKMKNLLNQNIPVIGHVPGHFLVITGSEGGAKVEPEYERGPWVQVWDQAEIVWQVNDPLFVVEEIGVETIHPNGSLQSVRVLLPSQTDQSYWLFEHPPEIEIKIFDASNQEIKVETEVVELWEDVEGDVVVEKQTLTTSWVEKPADGEYFLEVIDGNSNKEIKFWSYTEKAEVVFQKLNTNKNHHFIYTKELGAENSDLKIPTPEFSWGKFLDRLTQAWELKKIDEEYKYSKLKQIVQYALENPNSRYKSLVERFLTYNTSHETRSWLLGPNF